MCRTNFFLTKFVRQSAEPKIENPSIPVTIDHDVGRFQIAMQKTNIVCGGQSGANLTRELKCLVLRQPADAAHQRREFFAFDVFHRKKMTAIDLADVVNAADIFVRDLPCHAHLAMKARQRRAIAQQVFRKKLECDRLSEFQIVSAIDFAHAAFAEQADDAIAIGEDGSGNEARVVNRIEGSKRALVAGFAPGSCRWIEALRGFVKRKAAG